MTWDQLVAEIQLLSAEERQRSALTMPPDACPRKEPVPIKSLGTYGLEGGPPVVNTLIT